MAKERLATLTVWIDREDDSCSSDSAYKRGDRDSYVITLRPKGDERCQPETGGDTAGVLAHELGHFVGGVMETKDAKEAGWQNSTTNQQLAGEREAWRFAEIIKPGINPQLVRDACKSMEDIVKDFPGVPMGFLKFIGAIE